MDGTQLIWLPWFPAKKAFVHHSIFCVGCLNRHYFWNKIQPFWIKVVHLVPNGHTLADFAVGALHLATKAKSNNENHLSVWHKKFGTVTILKWIFCLAQITWTSSKYFGSCRWTRHSMKNTCNSFAKVFLSRHHFSELLVIVRQSHIMS